MTKIYLKKIMRLRLNVKTFCHKPRSLFQKKVQEQFPL